MSIPHIKNYCAGLISADFNEKILAQERIRGLSNENRKTLVKLFQGKLVDENRVNALDAEIQKISNHAYVYKPKGFITDTWNAVKHLFGARIYSSEVYDEISSKLSNKDAVFAVNATYQTNGKGICDVAFANDTVGFGYIADGAGHNKPKMSKVLNFEFDRFNKNYEASYNRDIKGAVYFNDSPLSEQEYKVNFINRELTSLGRIIDGQPDPVNKSNPLDKPAFSFAQIVNIQGKHQLLTSQAGNTMILIKKSDGSFDTSLVKKGENHELGKDPSKFPPVLTTDVNDNDVVYGFSSGIGDYLTMSELQKCITENKHAAVLLDEIKEFIIKKGEKLPTHEINQESANGNISTFSQRVAGDDIGMFMLKVKPLLII